MNNMCQTGKTPINQVRVFTLQIVQLKYFTHHYVYCIYLPLMTISQVADHHCHVALINETTAVLSETIMFRVFLVLGILLPLPQIPDKMDQQLLVSSERHRQYEVNEIALGSCNMPNHHLAGHIGGIFRKNFGQTCIPVEMVSLQMQPYG